MRSPDSRPTVLIADDQPDVLEALRFLVKGEGYAAEAVNSPGAAIDAVESRDFDVVLMDLSYTRDATSGQEGLELRNRQRLEAENRALRAERFPQLIAGSTAMRPVLDVISRVGPSDANVMITGENGTGKGLVAQTLH